MLNFTEFVEDEHGRLIISGLEVDHSSYDPLAQIWSAIRKINRKDYNIDTVGTFRYPDKSIIICDFYLNHAGFDEPKKDKKDYLNEVFKATFAYQMQNFQDAIITFIESPEGLETFNTLAKTAFFDEMDKAIDDFLLKYGYRKKSKKSKKSKYPSK